MTIGRRLPAAAAVALGLLLGACKPNAAGDTPDAEAGSGFDFLVLSLSWSPSYCEAEGADANRRQCGTGRDHGFVVHGLWPQFEKSWPEFCDSSEPDRVPDGLVRRYVDLIPSAGLIGHQWRKHGTCSGLSQADYFALTRRARERVAVPARFEALRQSRFPPDEVEDAFIAANPGLRADAIAVTCEASLLREVRLCLTKQLDFRSCPEIDARSCRAASTRMPAPG